jgi:AcrR family transcriptional regulator
VTPRTQKKTRRLTRAEKREANRERILRAARTVFGARGFHGATIEEIADESGLSNGAIYYNFDSKGDLFLALLEERHEERILHLRRTLGTAPQAGKPDKGLGEEARDATRSLKDSREWRLLVFEFVAHAARNPALAPRLGDLNLRLRAALAELMEGRVGDRAGSMSADDVALVAIALANGLAFEEAAAPGSVPDALLGDLVALLLAHDPGNRAT